MLGLRYHPVLDALFHGSYFFVVTLLLHRPCTDRVPARIFYLTLLLISFLLEVVQAWVPGRSFSLADLAANAAGVTGATLVQYLRNYKTGLLTSKYSS